MLIQRGLGIFAIICSLSVSSPSKAQETFVVPSEEIAVRKLPDLNVPRAGHIVISLNGDPVVIGGHTTGFVPVSEVEYFHGGRWHVINSIYEHDNSFSLRLSPGKVLIGGGHDSDLGIGQSFSVEIYDHNEKSFTPISILDNKRVLSTAAAISDGRAVISGNWYNVDSIEVWTPGKGFKTVKPVSVGRVSPVILRSSKDNVLIFGEIGNRVGYKADPSIVDRLVGEPLNVPLLKKWSRVSTMKDFRYEESLVEVSADSVFTYLLAASDTAGNIGILKVCGEEFSMLETEGDIPLDIGFGHIGYSLGILVDRARERAFITGFGHDFRIYLLEISYKEALKGGKAGLKLYYTKPMEDIGIDGVMLTDDGGLLFCGGTYDSNFAPFSGAYILYPDGICKNAVPWWAWMLGGVLLATILAFVILRRRRSGIVADEEPSEAENRDSDTMMMDIENLMNKEKIYLVSSLSLSDIARRLGTNVRYVSECINHNVGIPFPSYVNGYRIRYAMELMKAHPEKKLSEVAEECGFSNEGTFFRNFRMIVGVTPSQWLSQTK